MKYQLTPEQRAILEALVAERDSIGMSDTEFTRRHLPFTSSKWSRIVAALKPDSESYFDLVQDRDSVFAELENSLREIRREKSQQTRFSDEAILPLTEFNIVCQSVRDCRQKKNPERLVVYLAPTGGGKSFLCQYLRQEFSANVVETREAWRRSYYTCLKDICYACRIRTNNESNPSRMEDMLIDNLNSRASVLVLDEAEFFGVSALNGIKLLLNKTRVTIVIASIPEAYHRWNRYFPMEAAQIRRRTHRVVEAFISEKTVVQFFPGVTFESSDAIKSIVAAASAKDSGAFSLVRRIRDILSPAKNVTDEELGKAITKAQRQMRHAL